MVRTSTMKRRRRSPETRSSRRSSKPPHHRCRISPREMLAAPPPRAPLRPLPTSSASGAHPVSTGDPSPFHEPPTAPEERKRFVGTPMKIVIAVVALAAGIYLADMAATTAPAVPTVDLEESDGSEPAAGGEGPAPTLADDHEESSSTALGSAAETGAETGTGIMI